MRAIESDASSKQRAEPAVQARKPSAEHVQEGLLQVLESVTKRGCRESREPHGALAIRLMSALSVRMGGRGAALRCWLDLLVPCLGPQNI